MDDRKVFYIRHNGFGENITKYLIDNEQIGVHFATIADENQAFELSSYKRDYLEKILHIDTLIGYNETPARTCINYINACSNKEHIIVASYEGYDKIVIGLSKKDSKKCHYLEDGINKQIQMKCVQLRNTMTLTKVEFPLPFLVPPQRSTFVEWHMGTKMVKSLFDGYTPEIEGGAAEIYAWFSPWQLEILCEEWLRMKSKFKRKLFQTGRTMKEFDIVGLNIEDKVLVAQVKHACSGNDIEVFLKNADKFEKYFFAPEYVKTMEKYINNSCVISNIEVIEDFINYEPTFLQALLVGRVITNRA
ncbi:MAG: hypothetical protein IPM69_11875 [Ignavibacteria bacterium]|nr:hypothetical protein [Ignavibacteria bacterium]